MEIVGCTLSHAAAYSGGRIFIRGSLITHDLEVKDAGSEICGCRNRGRFEVIRTDGGVYREVDSEVSPWAGR